MPGLFCYMVLLQHAAYSLPSTLLKVCPPHCLLQNSGQNLSLVCVPYTGTGQLIASTCPYPSARYSTSLSSFTAAYGPLACASNSTAICDANRTYITAANYANASGLASSSQASNLRSASCIEIDLQSPTAWTAPTICCFLLLPLRKL